MKYFGKKNQIRKLLKSEKKVRKNWSQKKSQQAGQTTEESKGG